MDGHNCVKYQKALSQPICTLCHKRVENGFMKIHFEFDCMIIKFFEVKMPFNLQEAFQEDTDILKGDS